MECFKESSVLCFAVICSGELKSLHYIDRVPGVGYYNEDETPDFMVRFNKGPGFPTYYDSQV